MSIPISRLIVLKDRLQSTDDAVLKKTLKELDRVDMTLEMLKETGIGKIVNQLRHHENFGSMARQLVTKWKEHAVGGESSPHTNGYGTSKSSKRARDNRNYSSSPSPPPVIKKSKSDSKSSTTKSKPEKNLKFAEASLDDEDGGNFTAQFGSFEEILGLNDSAQRYSTSTVKNHHAPPREKTKKSTTSYSTDYSTDSPTTKKSKSAENGHTKATTAPSSNGVDWSKVLPTKVATEYRPQPQRPLINDYDDDSGAGNDSDGIDFSQMKKSKLTKIYSGRRNIFLQQVPTLYESCIRVICDNIDALEYTGGLPFDILKPVLERASAQQLYKIEEWNPYLLEDTGDLWKGHCKREFKDVEPDWEEGETWRELYERMLAERAKKLNKLTQAISVQKAAKESAVRQAKMALPKAPREVRRRQIQYGTYRKEEKLVGAEEIVQSRRNLDVRPGAKGAGRAFSHIYEDEQRQKEQPKNRKEKIAPLMAKSLKMMKMSRSRN